MSDFENIWNNGEYNGLLNWFDYNDRDKKGFYALTEKELKLLCQKAYELGRGQALAECKEKIQEAQQQLGMFSTFL